MHVNRLHESKSLVKTDERERPGGQQAVVQGAAAVRGSKWPQQAMIGEAAEMWGCGPICMTSLFPAGPPPHRNNVAPRRSLRANRGAILLARGLPGGRKGEGGRGMDIALVLLGMSGSGSRPKRVSPDLHFGVADKTRTQYPLRVIRIPPS